MSDLDVFLTGAVTNTCVGLAIFAVFTCVRSYFPGWYAPRSHQGAPRAGGRRAPPIDPPKAGVVGWAKSAWKPSRDQLTEKCGLDAAMFIELFRIGFVFFSIAALLAATVLMPVNATSSASILKDGGGPHHNTTSSRHVDGLAIFSLASLPAHSDRLYAPLIVAYMLSAVALYLLNQTYGQYAGWRQAHLRSAHHLTVLVRDVPPAHGTSVRFATWMRRLYGGALLRASLVPHTGSLPELVATRDKVVAALQAATDAWAAGRRRANGGLSDAAESARPTHKQGGVPYLGWGGTPVDSISHYQRELDTLNRSVTREQARVADGDGDEGVTYARSGFATFNDPVTAAAATRATQSVEPLTFACEAASEPNDIIWANLFVTVRARAIREACAHALTFGLLVLWVIPISFIAALTTLEALGERVPFLAKVAAWNPVLRGFLQSFLPGVALLLFLKLLPALLIAQARLSGLPTRSQCDRNAIARFFMFHASHSFILLTLAGSIFDQLDSVLVTSPAKLANLLGTSLPQFGTFFTTFIMLEAMVALPLSLLDPAALGLYIARKRLLGGPGRQALEQPREVSAVSEYGGVLLPFIICFAYCVIQPVICFVAVAFFAFGWLVARYRALYISKPVCESGGLLWPLVFDLLTYSLIIGQTTLLGVFALKQHKVVAPLAVPLPYLTLVVARRIREAWLPSTETLTVEEAALLRDSHVDEMGDDIDEFAPPELRVPDTVVVEAQSREKGATLDLTYNPIGGSGGRGGGGGGGGAGGVDQTGFYGRLAGSAPGDDDEHVDAEGPAVSLSLSTTAAHF